MIIGYARVSTQDQNLDIQTKRLKEYGCEKIFKEKISSIKVRLEFNNLLEQLRFGDILVVCKLDRLGRSLRDLIDLVTYFDSQNIEFISLNDNIDTTTSQGRLIFNIFASFAEFERILISERTKLGLEAARAKGHFGGRKPGLSKKAKKIAKIALIMSRNNKWSVADILNHLSITKSTYYRYLKWAKEEEKSIKLIADP